MLRKIIMLSVLSVIIPLFANTFLFAGDDSGLPGAFLRLPVNARANGMGSAFTALSQDPSAGYWNPAGLGFIDNFQLNVMYSLMSMDRRHNFAGVSLPSENCGTLGIHWKQFGVSNIDGRDSKGIHTEYFSDNEMALGLSYGYKIGSYCSIGATGKYLLQFLQDYKAKGYSFDVGVMVNLKEEFYLGFVAKNIFSSLQWDTESAFCEILTKTYRAGIGIKPLALPILFTLDALKFDTENNDKTQLFGGCEVWLLPDILALRGGIANGELTAGASIGWKGKDFGFRLDFAYLQDVLEQGATSQISFGIEF